MEWKDKGEQRYIIDSEQLKDIETGWRHNVRIVKGY